MHDPLRMRRFQGIRNLNPQIEKLADLEVLAAHPLGERFTLEQLHHDEVSPLVLLDGMDGTDTRVIERGGRPCLPLEALENGGIVLHLIGKELDRDAPPELAVLRLVDHPHAAGAELAEDLVVRDGAADLELHRRWFLFGESGGNYTPGGDPQANGAGTAREQRRFRKPVESSVGTDALRDMVCLPSGDGSSSYRS